MVTTTILPGYFPCPLQVLCRNDTWLIHSSEESNKLDQYEKITIKKNNQHPRKMAACVSIMYKALHSFSLDPSKKIKMPLPID
jgi:hypothetical protein